MIHYFNQMILVSPKYFPIEFVRTSKIRIIFSEKNSEVFSQRNRIPTLSFLDPIRVTSSAKDESLVASTWETGSFDNWSITEWNHSLMVEHIASRTNSRINKSFINWWSAWEMDHLSNWTINQVIAYCAIKDHWVQPPWWVPVKKKQANIVGEIMSDFVVQNCFHMKCMLRATSY